MNLEPMQYVSIGFELLRRVVRQWQRNGRLTLKEKEQVFVLVEILTAQLFRCISDLSRELGKFGGEFKMPRVQDGCLEYKCTDADNQGDSGDPLGEPRISRRGSLNE